MDVDQINRDLVALQDLAGRITRDIEQLSTVERLSLPENRSPIHSLIQKITQLRDSGLTSARPEYPAEGSAFDRPLGEQMASLEPDRRESGALDFEQLLAQNQRQQSLLDAIFEADPSGLAVLVGAELRIVFANPAYRFICPPGKTEILGQAFASVWEGEPEATFRAQIEQVLQTGRPFQVPHFGRQYPDGAKRYFTLQARRIDWGGQPAALLIHWDTTEAYRAEQATLENERRISTVLSSITDSCFMLDRDWRFTRINEQALAYFQKTWKELLGRPFWEVFPAARGTRVEENYTRAFREQVPIHYEILSPISGMWVEVHVYPSSEGMLVIFRDITPRRQSEEQLRQLLAQVEEQAAELNTLFDALTDVVVLFDPHGKPLRANRSAIEAFGFDPSHSDRASMIQKIVLRKPNGSLYQVEDLPSSRALRGSYVSNEKAIYTHISGETRTMLVSALPVYKADRQLAGIVLTWHDVTGTERAAAILDHYQVLFAQTREILLFVRLSDGLILEANRAAEEAYGYAREELLQLTIQDLRADDTRASIGPQMAEADQKGIVFVTRHRRKDGSTFPVEVSSRGADFEGQRTNLSIIRDITEQIRADEQIRLQVAALEATVNGVVITDRQGMIQWANPGFTRLTGFTLQEAAGKNPRELVRSGVHDRAFFQKMWETILSGKVWQGEVVNRRKDTSLYSETMTITPVCNVQGEITHFIAVKQDITEQKRAEEQVQARNVQVELQQRLLEQREQERLQIARDLHDGPLQELIAATFTLQGMMQDSPDPSQVEAYAELQTNLQETVAELRGYAQELRSPVLSKFGLEKAIQAHLETFQEKHPDLQVQFEARQEGAILPDPIRLALFRIFQETLNNIVKHARASQVAILLTKRSERVELDIRDNGMGFELPKDWLELARQGHLGLVGMRERAQAAGGELRVESAPGRGTHIQISIPLPKPADQETQ